MKKRKAHLRDWKQHLIALILFPFTTEDTERTKCGIVDDFILERDEEASQESEMQGIVRLNKDELCKNCLATLNLSSQLRRMKKCHN